MQDKPAPYIHLVYGLAYPNAGESPGNVQDRTVALAKAFFSFARKLYKTFNPFGSPHEKLRYLRYRSLMPRFDDSGSELAIIFDALNEPKYGCILSYRLSNQAERQEHFFRLILDIDAFFVLK